MYKERIVLNLLIIYPFMGTRGSAQDSYIGKTTYLTILLNWMLYAIYKGYIIFKILKSFNPL